MTRPRKKPTLPQTKGKDPGVLAAARKPNDVEQGISGPEKAISLEKLSLPGKSAKSPSSSAPAAFSNDSLDFFMMMKNTVNYSDIDLNPKGKHPEAQVWERQADMTLSSLYRCPLATQPAQVG